MTGDQTANLLYSLLFLLLVLSSLVARRLPIGQALKYALAWLAIFAGAVVLYSFRGVAGQAWDVVKRELNPGTPVESGRGIRILMGEDGHFRVDAKVNGHNVSFMIDSGATTTMMSQADALASNMPVDESGFPVAIETANGVTTMRRARAASLKVGSIVREDFAMLVSSDANDDVNLLGMNFLSSLGNWRVEGREMVLEP